MRKKTLIAFLVIAAASFTTPSSAHDEPGAGSKVTVLYDYPLPNVPGKSLRGVLVEYPPGGTSPAHTHAKSAFIAATVVEGAIRSAVNDGKPQVYKAGEHFTEMPGDRHAVSENASTTDSARLIAVFVVDTKDTVLTTPITK